MGRSCGHSCKAERELMKRMLRKGGSEFYSKRK
jgi:hypothetical protein